MTKQLIVTGTPGRIGYGTMVYPTTGENRFMTQEERAALLKRIQERKAKTLYLFPAKKGGKVA